MARQDSNYLHDILDDIQKTSNETKEISISTRERVSVIEEHLRAMNGKLVEHSKYISTQPVVCGQQFKEINTILQENKSSIVKAQGIAIGFSLVVTILGVLGTTKALGLW